MFSINQLSMPECKFWIQPRSRYVIRVVILTHDRDIVCHKHVFQWREKGWPVYFDRGLS